MRESRRRQARALGDAFVRATDRLATALGRIVSSFVRATDRLTATLGRIVSWLVLAMVLIGAYNALVRYLGRFTGVGLSSNLYLELQWYLFSLIFLLGAGYALKEDAHVRVDVLYGRLGKRGRAWIDAAGASLMLLPFCLFVLWVSWPSVKNSWGIREGSPDPSGLPRYPLKTVILACFVLLAVQGLAQLAKDVRTLRAEPADGGNGNGADGSDEPDEAAPHGRASATGDGTVP